MICCLCSGPAAVTPGVFAISTKSWRPQIRREKLSFFSGVTLRACIPCHLRLLRLADRGREHQQDHTTSGSFHNQVLAFYNRDLCEALTEVKNQRKEPRGCNARRNSDAVCFGFRETHVLH